MKSFFKNNMCILSIFVICVSVYFIPQYFNISCEKYISVKSFFDSLSVCSSIVSFGITMLLYYKIKVILSPNEKIKKMIKSMTSDNNFFDVGLNMKIDISSPPSQKIKEIMEIFSNYNNCVDKITSNTDEALKRDYKTIGLPNHRNKLNLMMLALEIQILELEIQNKKFPTDSDINQISKKINQFVLSAKKTGYVD